MKKVVLILLVLLLFASVCFADEDRMFEQGHKSFSLVGGNGHAFNSDYSVIGVGASYYIDDGFGVGFSYENWSGGNLGITKYAPFVQYVFYDSTLLKPYLGILYRHTSIDGLSDIDSIGGRAGFYYSSGRNAYVSVGLVYENYLKCQETVYHTCSLTYPDIGFTIGF